ncbi:MAG: hypothetical protein VXX04_06360, partial [Actinomycetota bacterium]|nr:hypothetical protein [Actinomycetota bacterium]
MDAVGEAGLLVVEMYRDGARTSSYGADPYTLTPLPQAITTPTGCVVWGVTADEHVPVYVQASCDPSSGALSWTNYADADCSTPTWSSEHGPGPLTTGTYPISSGEIYAGGGSAVYHVLTCTAHPRHPVVASCDCSCYPPNSHGAAAYYCGPGSIDPRCDHGGSCDLSFAYCYDGGNAHDNYGCDFHGDEAGPCCAAPLPSPSPEPSESPPPWSSACGASWLASGMWYVLGASGSASCGVCGEPVFDYAECVAAAAVGVGVLGIGPLDGVHGWAGPAGCHVQEGSNFQFNSEFAGFGVLGHTPVCRAAAPPLASPSPSPESLACYATCAHAPTSCWEFMEMAAGCASSCPESTLASFAHLLCSGTVVGSP